ncbi:MAG: UbiX family flavin prenyltransferase [Planctomycetota bacterium]
MTEIVQPEAKTFAVGISGASGAPIARRLVEILLETGHRLHLCASRAGRLVIQDELKPEPVAPGLLPGIVHDRLVEWGERDFRAPFASGSAPIDGMVIVPCSMSTVAAVARGISDNLIRRGADVMLKERRPLVVVPRESPLSEIHLENLRALARAGAVIVPPVLTFYQQPGSGVEAQVGFVVSRILDHLGVPNQLYRRWGS